MWNPSLRTSGIRAADATAAGVTVLLAVVLGACNYTFQAGAGLPPHVRTLAVVPFENETGRFEVTQEVYNALLEELPRSFGVRTAGEEHADAVVSGTIRNYAVATPSFRPSSDGQRAEVVEREVTLTVEIEIIDQVNNVILWDNRSLSARGQFAEASELEEDGRRVAITRLVQAVVDGLQSNW